MRKAEEDGARGAAVDRDRATRWAIRGLTVLALVLFLAWIATVDWWLLLAAVLSGAGAYRLLRLDIRRHPEVYGLSGAAETPENPEEDRVMEGSEDTIAPGVSAGGIHLTFEKRTRWKPRG